MWKVDGEVDDNHVRLTGPGMERIEVDKRDEVSIDGLHLAVYDNMQTVNFSVA